jgi:hypothetical protein
VSTGLKSGNPNLLEPYGPVQALTRIALRLLVPDYITLNRYVMHHQFNIQQLYALPTLYVYLCVSYYPRIKSDLCHLQHKPYGFYNQDEKCLQRGTDWVFK